VRNHRQSKWTPVDYVAADHDVELQILAELQELESLGLRVSLTHVKSHQSVSESSPTSVIYNVAADELASKNLHCLNCCSPYDEFPTMRVILESKDGIISGSIKQAIRFAVLTPPLRHYLRNKYWSSKLLDAIWWTITGQTLQRFQIQDKFRIIKFNFHKLYTRSIEHKIHPSVSPLCPLCSTIDETNDHLMWCRCLRQEQQQLMDELHTQLQRLLPNSPIHECFLEGLKSWIHQTSPPLVKNFYSDASEFLEEAYAEQTEIGWDHFFRGRWSIKWAALYNHSCPLTKHTPSAETWGRTITETMWKGLLSIWKKRNELLHGKHPIHYHTLEKIQLLQEIQTIIQSNPQGFTQFRFKHFKTKNAHWLESWIKRYKSEYPEGNHILNYNRVVDS
jgi:hypothetical protein